VRGLPGADDTCLAILPFSEAQSTACEENEGSNQPRNMHVSLSNLQLSFIFPLLLLILFKRNRFLFVSAEGVYLEPG